ncbi:LysR family transcriptional regulator [uncultured Hydrogenophaga sp.]|uniref:LysR family transcriptional regulator n=1 Tax=uncultured Hydrogenophaga sp. TaxID=199683 RepID=UPI0025877C9B|nr:LysR family transcriptional regulator [uncultured Hydrogenophaga sp.]
MAIHKNPAHLGSLPSVRQLRAFVAVYDSGQLSAAAEALSLTQPAVTVLLRELEARLGVRLFDRSTRSLRRTEAAAEAIGHARRALAEMQALSGGMASLARGERGRLRIAATSTVAQTLLPAAVRRYLDRHPAIEVQIDDCAPGEFAERVLAGQVDLGLGTLEGPVPGLSQRVVLRDHLAAVAPAGPRFAADKPLTWKQLAAWPVITVRPGYGVRRRIDAAAREAGVELRVAHEVSLLTTAVALAAAGLGVAVVPGSVFAPALHPELVARRLVRPVVERDTAVVFKSDRSLSPAAQVFAELMERGEV